jgi:hypothetical protein
VERSRAPRSDEARAQAAGAAARTRRRADRRLPADHGRRSWAVRVAAIGLLALLMIALIVILASLL